MKHDDRMAALCYWHDACAADGEQWSCHCADYDDGSDRRDIFTYNVGLVERQLDYLDMMMDYDDGNGRLDF